MPYGRRRRTGITKVTDLVGKTVGASPDNSERILFPALAAVNKFDPKSVKFVSITSTGNYAMLASGSVDAIFDFTTGAPFVEQAVGKDNAVSIPWSSSGLDLYGLAIFCNNETITKRPDVVKRFLAASFKGWQYAITNTQKALEAEQQFAPQVDIPTYTANFKLALELMCTQRFHDHGMGYIDPKKMADTINVIQKYMQAKSSISDPASVYVPDLLTKVDLPECGKLT